MKKFFIRFRFVVSRFIRPKPKILERPEGWLPIRVPIAGVMHKEQYISVSELTLLEMVTLIREPKNEFDLNAIEIKRLDGKRLGYVGKAISKNLAPFMDKEKQLIHALVTDIMSDISGAVFGASICLYIPKDVYSLIVCEDKKDIDYFIETVNDGAVYLFISCDEAMLNQLNYQFSYHQMRWVRSGLSYRPASNGMQYKWYARFEGINQELIDRFIRQELSIIPYGEKVRKELDDYIQAFDPEIKKIKQQQLISQEVNQTLRYEKELLQNRIDYLEQNRSNKWNSEIRIILKELLPNIALERDSLSIITHELKDFQQLLKILRAISCSPDQLKGLSVKSAKGWFEKHFSTGEKNDGRIYYKKVGERWVILISNKKNQANDIQWLKKK